MSNPASDDLWDPWRASTPAALAIIERGKPENDRAGVPFGFGRALADDPIDDDWTEYAAALAGR